MFRKRAVKLDDFRVEINALIRTHFEADQQNKVRFLFSVLHVVNQLNQLEDLPAQLNQFAALQKSAAEYPEFKGIMGTAENIVNEFKNNPYFIWEERKKIMQEIDDYRQDVINLFILKKMFDLVSQVKKKIEEMPEYKAKLNKPSYIDRLVGLFQSKDKKNPRDDNNPRDDVLKILNEFIDKFDVKTGRTKGYVLLNQLNILQGRINEKSDPGKTFNPLLNELKSECADVFGKRPELEDFFQRCFSKVIEQFVNRFSKTNLGRYVAKFMDVQHYHHAIQENRRSADFQGKIFEARDDKEDPIHLAIVKENKKMAEGSQELYEQKFELSKHELALLEYCDLRVFDHPLEGAKVLAIFLPQDQFRNFSDALRAVIHQFKNENNLVYDLKSQVDDSKLDAGYAKPSAPKKAW